MSDKAESTAPSTTSENPFAAPAHNPFAGFSFSTDATATGTGSTTIHNPFDLGANTTTSTAPTSESNEKTNEDGAEGGDDTAVSGADSTAHYEPVMKLEIIETSTGEENDEEIYKQRAALYRFDSSTNEWKERGRGDCKLLKNKSSGKIRILLRQDKTLKCCMNHIVHPDVALRPNAGSEKSWTWRCTDFSGESPEAQTFALRFKDADTAQAFKTKFDEVRKINEAIIKKE